MDNIPKTIFCDIDGVLFEHPGKYTKIYDYKPVVLEGTWQKIQEWHMKGYMIIITTSRFPSMRNITEKQLNDAKIPYHQLIMGVNRGARVVINDLKTNSDEATAVGISLPRNKGIQDLDI